MRFICLAFQNLLNAPLLSFLAGLATSIAKPSWRLPPFINAFLTPYILFCIGLKGGGPFIEHCSSSALLFAAIVGALVLWGLFQPLLSFFLLKSFTRIDSATAAAVSASLGSVSVMTFVTAVSFLDQQHMHYQELIIAALAIMEIPAIVSGVFLAKRFDESSRGSIHKTAKVLRESLMNKAILGIVAGLVSGALLYLKDWEHITGYLLLSFKPLLCLFLFDMGLQVGRHREHFRSFSWSLNFFGIYMPLLGGIAGLALSYLLRLDPGTGTLVAVLTASSSYIAVPAAMRIALPQAKEAIYLPLSLGIVFPFNVLIGIPLYYHIAGKILSRF